MNARLAAACGVVLMMAASGYAEAKGCIKGGVVGGVAGHAAGHHGAAGAAVGCAVGHHEANKHEKQAAAAQQAQQPEQGSHR